MKICPGKDLFFAERRKEVDVTNASMFAQELSQGTATRQATKSLTEGSVYSRPRLEPVSRNSAARWYRPFAGQFAVGIGPAKDFGDVQGAEVELAWHRT